MYGLKVILENHFKERSSMEHYKLNYETKNIILELKKKAEELQLGNVSFDYYERGNTIKFFITEYKITGN